MQLRALVGTAVVASSLAIGSSATASITVTDNTNANSLANAILGAAGGVSVISATLQGHTNGSLASSGTYSATANNYNLSGTGAVLSSGAASHYSSGANTSPSFTFNWATFNNGGGLGAPASGAQEALLDPITGGTFTHYDVTTLTIQFTATASEIGFRAVFGSEEYSRYVGSQFIDGFGIYLNGSNIAFSGGNPVNINHPDFAFIAETELDGVVAPLGNPLLTFNGSVLGGGDGSTVNELTFIIGDSSDGAFDSTVFIQSFAIPAPGAFAPFAFAVALGRRRRRQA